MKFICAECRAIHKVARGPLDPNAPFAITKWYKDKKGLDHFAAACFKCGAIHDAVGSFKAIVGKPWRTIAIVKCEFLVEAHRLNPSGKNLQEFVESEAGLPKSIVQGLVRSGHLKIERGNDADHKSMPGVASATYTERQETKISQRKDLPYTSDLEELGSRLRLKEVIGSVLTRRLHRYCRSDRSLSMIFTSSDLQNEDNIKNAVGKAVSFIESMQQSKCSPETAKSFLSTLANNESKNEGR